MAYLDTLQPKRRIQTFRVPQIVAPGVVESRETFPSFHYQPATGEFAANALQLPWPETGGYLVGQFARDHGTMVPGRLIGSAKSWLCHSGVDRNANLLPWQGAEDVERVSPVVVSSRYLQHFRQAWDAQFPSHPLAEQDLILTLPASFDEVARELTIKGAKLAGLQRVVLIEEPQAAFYAWIDKYADRWDQLVAPGQTILVCDVGGGTTDFTLIRVRSGASGVVQFHRIAVGEHLILGGDNLDLALAHYLEQRVKPGGQLEPRQWGVLVRSCRQLKEVLLGENPPAQSTLTLPGSGSKLIGGSIQIPVERVDVESMLSNGFFPQIPLDSKPLASQSGFQEFGLPYAADAAITKYLASFLTAHRLSAGEDLVSSNGAVSSTSPSPESLAIRPDVLLFNGGVFASPLFRNRLIQSLEHWFQHPGNPDWSPIVLENERLDLAVARGAAYYGMVRRGEGVRISAGLARTYYIGVENSEKAVENSASANEDSSTVHPPVTAATTTGTTATKTAVTTNAEKSNLNPSSAFCLIPAGIEPGQEVDLSQHQFQLLVSQPIEFPLFVSSTRLADRPGELVAIDPDQIRSLPPIRTVLKTGKSKDAAAVAVILKAKLTEIGTLDLSCSEVGGKRSWKLLFDVRSTTQTDIAAHDATGEQQGVLDEEVLQSARQVIQSAFSLSRAAVITPGSVGLVGPVGPGQRDQSTTLPASTADRASYPRSPDANPIPVTAVTKRLVEVLNLDRDEWPTTLLRQLWEVLIECEPGRRISAQHEARWLNLVGYSLRPGYGLAVDDWRCNETWKLLQGKLAFETTACQAEWSILWRRVAGGLTAGQQQSLAAPLLSQIRQVVRQPGFKGKANDFGNNMHESAETIRLLGACELLPLAMKQEFGDLLLEMLERPRFSALNAAGFWSLGRVGARRPVYGPLNSVIPPETASRWLMRLLKLELIDPLAPFAAMQLARKTGDRYRDIDEATRARVLKGMERVAVTGHYRDLVTTVTSLESEEQSLILGDVLPKGLRIR
jgi:hypothetical protein